MSKSRDYETMTSLPLEAEYSSNVNEVIRAVLCFFYEKILQAQKAQKSE